MKIAFFVLGPESSGTRMMAQAFVTLGIYGDYTHGQRLDKNLRNNDFKKIPNLIVIRRSIPHGVDWVKISEIVKKLESFEYDVVPIFITREREATAKSQVKHHHTPDIKTAHAHISKAINHIYRGLAVAGKNPHVIHYEPFVQFQRVRKMFFAQFGLGLPKMEFYNANDKYKKNQ